MDKITVGYTTHKKMIEERDREILRLKKKLEAAYDLLVEATDKPRVMWELEVEKKSKEE